MAIAIDVLLWASLGASVALVVPAVVYYVLMRREAERAREEFMRRVRALSGNITMRAALARAEPVTPAKVSKSAAPKRTSSSTALRAIGGRYGAANGFGAGARNSAVARSKANGAISKQGKRLSRRKNVSD